MKALHQKRLPLLLSVCCSILLTTIYPVTAIGQLADPRNFDNGSLIPDEKYCDQPYIVQTKDGNWLCTLTTGAGGEGGEGQHMVASISKDKGKTWSPLIDIEPATGPASSYGVPLVLPNGRVYVFYNYNHDNIKAVDSTILKRPDLGGWYVFKYSDDHGRTWSDRHRLPLPLAAVDTVRNPLNGKFQLFWGIDKPDIHDGRVYFAFTRMQKPVNWYGQGWMYTSSNILTEKDPAKIKWDLYPGNGKGIVRKEFGSLQEEHNVVPLSNGDLLCFYRTRSGFAVQSYSRDGGKTWSLPEKASYTPGGRIFKTPMACPQLVKLPNGKFLFWYHNTSSQVKGKDAPVACRNLGWIAAGTEKNGTVYWSQPELVNYNVERRRGCSYPDIIEEDGRYYLSSTNKDFARVQEIDQQLMENLFRQEQLKKTAGKGLLATASKQELKKGSMPMPALPDLSKGDGFSIDFRLKLGDLQPGKVLIDSRDKSGKGLLVETGSKRNLLLTLNDGVTTASWDSDPGLISTAKEHHITFIIDGGPKLISVVVDGLLCDGGDDPERPYGFGRFFAAENKSRKATGPDLTNVTGGPTLSIANSRDAAILGLRIYDRYLTTSEAIGNYHAAQ